MMIHFAALEVPVKEGRLAATLCGFAVKYWPLAGDLQMPVARKCRDCYRATEELEMHQRVVLVEFHSEAERNQFHADQAHSAAEKFFGRSLPNPLRFSESRDFSPGFDPVRARILKRCRNRARNNARASLLRQRAQPRTSLP